MLTSEEFSEQRRLPGRSTHPDWFHAIDIKAGLILADAEHANAGTVIHEMGHVFLKEGHPSSTSEPDWLGWEIVMARQNRCYRAWALQNNDYIVPYGDTDIEWNRASPNQLRSIISSSIARSTELGLIDANGRPRCTRTFTKQPRPT